MFSKPVNVTDAILKQPLTNVGQFAIREYKITGVCNVGETHFHKYDHTTFVIAGEIIVEFFEKVGSEIVFKNRTKICSSGNPLERFVLIPKNTIHRIKSKSQICEYCCVFQHRNDDGMTVEYYKGNGEAYI